MQYILRKKSEFKTGKNIGEETSSVMGYFTTESSLLLGVIKHGMNDSGIESVSQIKTMIEDAVNKLKGSR